MRDNNKLDMKSFKGVQSLPKILSAQSCGTKFKNYNTDKS